MAITLDRTAYNLLVDDDGSNLVGTVWTKNQVKTVVLDPVDAALATLGDPAAVAHGGTGIASYAVGDLLYASGATTLAKLADVATGNVLVSGGVTTAPAWGKVGLTTHVSGTLPTANGGTGIASYAVGDLLYADTTATLAKRAAVAVGQVLVSAGVGAAPAWSASPTLTSMLVGDGLVGSPSLAFVNEPTSGWFRNGAGDIWFAKLGIVKLKINSVGFTAVDGIVSSTIYGTGGALYLGGAVRNDWQITGAVGHLVALTDNTLDIGAAGATRPRTGYFGTSVVNAGFYEGTEMTAPAAGAVNAGRLYFEDNGAGKTRLMVLFNTGAAQQIAIQP